ncbi:MAG TPA: cytochrome c-type biogenesis protein [Gammaproteobacteria bacterium]|nr:cytochrome c-type biogenesis protein [Gammaproteobacteria bacterium]
MQFKYNFFKIISILCLFCSPTIWAANDIYSFSSEKDKQQFINLTKELRCLVCLNQSLADSDADLAKDLRKKIYLMIQEKKSAEEIRQFLVRRYGQFILFSPPLSPATLLLWGFPAFLSLLIFASLYWLVRRKARSSRETRSS